jgi:hypothetical protein
LVLSSPTIIGKPLTNRFSLFFRPIVQGYSVKKQFTGNRFLFIFKVNYQKFRGALEIDVHAGLCVGECRPSKS